MFWILSLIYGHEIEISSHTTNVIGRGAFHSRREWQDLLESCDTSLGGFWCSFG